MLWLQSPLSCVLRYKLRGAPVSHLCAVNAKAAMECGKFAMARMWKILKILTRSTAIPTSSLNSPEGYPQIICSMSDMLGFGPTPNPPSEASQSSQKSSFPVHLDEGDSQSGSSVSQVGGKWHSSSALSTKSDSRMDKSLYLSTAQASGGRAPQGSHGGTGEGVSSAISLDS